jgi:tungstate transport system substrate-binding protein
MTKSPLKIVSQGDPRLFNPYSIIPVNPERHPHVNYAGATALSDWITSSAGQELIGRFTINDRHLFTPSANTHSVATK